MKISIHNCMHSFYFVSSVPRYALTKIKGRLLTLNNLHYNIIKLWRFKTLTFANKHMLKMFLTCFRVDKAIVIGWIVCYIETCNCRSQSFNLEHLAVVNNDVQRAHGTNTRETREDLARMTDYSSRFPAASRFSRGKEKKKKRTSKRDSAGKEGKGWWVPLIVRWTTPINTAPFNGNSLQVSATMPASGFDLSPARSEGALRLQVDSLRNRRASDSSTPVIILSRRNALSSDIDARFFKRFSFLFSSKLYNSLFRRNQAWNNLDEFLTSKSTG